MFLYIIIIVIPDYHNNHGMTLFLSKAVYYSSESVQNKMVDSYSGQLNKFGGLR